MNKFEQALKGYINDESEDDFGSLYLESYLTISLHSIDKNATKTYTTQIFKEVKEHIVSVYAYLLPKEW